MKLIYATLGLLFLGTAAHAQSTGNCFVTPNGQQTCGSAVMIPIGPLVNGQPTMGPPSPSNGVPVLCTNCSPSAPTGASSNPVSGTISVSNTFQTLLAQNSSRKGCIFQNQGTHTMYFSVQGSPTEAGSLTIGPGSYFSCQVSGNIVITDAISITGTASDPFAGNWQ